MTPAIRIRIDFAENVNVGRGKIALLEAIKSTTGGAGVGSFGASLIKQYRMLEREIG